MTTQSTVVAVFKDVSRAQEALRALKAAGFQESHLGVVSPNKEVIKPGKKAKTKKSPVANGATVGLAAGVGIGALWTLGIAVGILPVIGPIAAGGLLTASLAGTAGSAVVAGILGTLIGMGIPEGDARYYEGELKTGRSLVTVKAEGRFEEACRLLKSHGGYTRPSNTRSLG